MFFIPLSQIESVELVIHALRTAAGLADCTVCPASRVCMKQCLTIADAIGQMVQSGNLPGIPSDTTPEPSGSATPSTPPQPKPTRGGLKVIK
jgi:hypothetical protein